jgi:hypothetical protein
MAGHIHYFCSPRHCYTLGIFAAYWAKEVGPSIRILPYNLIQRIPAFGPGIFIFSDLERVSADARDGLVRLADALAASGARVLNHPERVLGRLALLQALHAEGINDFTAYPLDRWREVRRFPVFIREADAHARPLTRLIHRPEDLAEAVAMVRAGRPRQPIVVEFGNARCSDGRYRKYSAFRVGEADYASTCQSNGHWWIKYRADVDEMAVDEHLRFVAENPHQAQLDAAWRIAGIEYGRADYCLLGGRVQLFEINTGPTISYLPDHRVADHWALADRQHEEALAQLIPGSGGGETANPLLTSRWPELDAERASALTIAWGRVNWPKNWARESVSA